MITSLVPSNMAPPFAKYAHGVLEANSGFILTSGQLATTRDGMVPDTAQAQAELIFCNIDKILHEAGTSRAGTLRINAYVTDREYMAGYMAARDAWLTDVKHLPASTLVIVSGFTRPEFFVEIEVTAIRVPPL